MKRDESDEELMLAYAAGDAAAFDALYGRHRGPTFRFIRRQVADDAIAQEIYQDVWMRVVNARGRYAPTAKFTTWLFTIAHNRMMDHFRSSGQHVEYVAFDADDDDAPAIDPPAPAAGAPDALLERKRLASRILAALAELPPAQREAFLLQQEGDLTVEDIARITDVGRETAKSRLRYALNKLRRDLMDLQ